MDTASYHESYVYTHKLMPTVAVGALLAQLKWQEQVNEKKTEGINKENRHT
jgi:uncharacterized membrane protein YfbV (UPF0208 family)